MADGTYIKIVERRQEAQKERLAAAEKSDHQAAHEHAIRARKQSAQAHDHWD